MKTDIISELVRSSSRGESLLEILRKVTNLTGAVKTDEDRKQLSSLIIKHSSEFPAKIRHVIQDISERPPQDVHSDAYMLVLRTIWDYSDASLDGRNVRRTFWHGLDSNVDTEDQIELTHRLYPSTLTLRQLLVGQDGFELYGPIEDLASSEKTVSFIPFMVDLSTEFGKLGIVNITKLSSILLNNTQPFKQFNEQTSTKLDEESLAALVRLREKGYVEDEAIGNLVLNFLRETLGSSRNFGFIEKRICLLIEWEPYLVKMQAGSVPSYLFAIFSGLMCEGTSKLDVRLYELALELGLLYYPRELLGFGFNGSTFLLACSLFGEEEVNRATNEKIAGVLAQGKTNEKKNKMLLAWILKAATDESICFDGLYTLLRFDPIALINSKKAVEW